MSLRWLSVMFLVLFCLISVDISDFSEIQLVCDGPTGRRTDIPYYRDARTHLKKEEERRKEEKKDRNKRKRRTRKKKRERKTETTRTEATTLPL